MVFPAPQIINFVPGSPITIDAPPLVDPPTGVPESQPFTFVGLLSAIGLGALSKRKLKRN